MNVHESNKSEVAWTSWLPALGYALGASKGPVIELGIGHFSTPFLHEFCKASGRDLYSVESDHAWRNAFDEIYGCDFHRFGYPISGKMDGKIPIEFGPAKRFGVVFIDNSPGGQARATPFRDALPVSEYVVVHDYHRENEDSIKPYLDGINYKVFNLYDPPTLLASLNHKV